MKWHGIFVYLSKILLFTFSPIMDYTELLLTLLLLTSYHFELEIFHGSNSRVPVLLMILTHETWICCIVRVVLMKKNHQMITEPVKLYYLQLSLVQYSFSWCNRPHAIPENGLLCHIWPYAEKKSETFHAWIKKLRWVPWKFMLY